MRLLTLINAVMRFKGFVFDQVFLTDQQQTLIIGVRPRKGSRPVCSGCATKGAVYDHLKPRLFRHVPLWGLPVYLEYVMRRVDCKQCGVKVECVPWADGRHRMTKDFRNFLSAWARRLPWNEVAHCFHTSWDTVYRAVQSAVAWGLQQRDLSGIHAIGVDEIQIGSVARHQATAIEQAVGIGRL